VAVLTLVAKAFAALLLIAAVVIVGLRIYFGRSAENELRPGEDVAITAFRGPVPENAFLVSHPDFARRRMQRRARSLILPPIGSKRIGTKSSSSSRVSHRLRPNLTTTALSISSTRRYSGFRT
jgi:hypothetical protein